MKKINTVIELACVIMLILVVTITFDSYRGCEVLENGEVHQVNCMEINRYEN